MTGLLDVSVLIALLWPYHEAHDRVQRWFAHNSRQGWATCAITEAGFVRIVSNPAFSQQPVSPQDALRVLAGSLLHPAHEFWTDDLTANDALTQFSNRLNSHQQVTDGYLLALAMRKQGRFVTLDAGIASLVANSEMAKKNILVL